MAPPTAVPLAKMGGCLVHGQQGGAFSDTLVSCGFAKKGLRVSRLPNLKYFGAEITYVTYLKYHIYYLSKILPRC